MSREELLQTEAIGSACGWVAPMAKADRACIVYLRDVFKRCNIVPSKATRLEYDSVVRVA